MSRAGFAGKCRIPGNPIGTNFAVENERILKRPSLRLGAGGEDLDSRPSGKAGNDAIERTAHPGPRKAVVNQWIGTPFTGSF